MTDFAVIIPHRDRGLDPNRVANLHTAVACWRSNGVEPIVVSDGRKGDAQWNRSTAYNRGASLSDADVLVYAEADILLPVEQVHKAVAMAAEAPGLVVPFSKFMALTEEYTPRVREIASTGRVERGTDVLPEFAEQVRGDRKSIGAVNVVSRDSLRLIGGGYDEEFEGHAYDDDSMEIAFRTCAGPTRFVDGPAWHQWHVPGAFYATSESTVADRAATASNRSRWELYRAAAGDPDRIRELTGGAR